MPAKTVLLRLALLAAIAAAVGGCGRRGALEPPGRAAAAGPATPAGQPSARAAASADEDDAEETVAAPVPAPAQGGRRKKGYTIPQKPFILDPIL